MVFLAGCWHGSVSSCWFAIRTGRCAHEHSEDDDAQGAAKPTVNGLGRGCAAARDSAPDLATTAQLPEKAARRIQAPFAALGTQRLEPNARRSGVARDTAVQRSRTMI